MKPHHARDPVPPSSLRTFHVAQFPSPRPPVECELLEVGVPVPCSPPHPSCSAVCQVGTDTALLNKRVNGFSTSRRSTGEIAAVISQGTGATMRYKIRSSDNKTPSSAYCGGPRHLLLPAQKPGRHAESSGTPWMTGKRRGLPSPPGLLIRLPPKGWGR